MSQHHQSIAPLLTVAMLFCIPLFISSLPTRADSQELPFVSPERERGVQLYKQGDMKGAIEALRIAIKHHKGDADAWHYLGLAFNRAGSVKDARKAFEMAVKLNPKSVASLTGYAYTLLLTTIYLKPRAKPNALLSLAHRTLKRITLLALRIGDPVKNQMP